MDSDRRDFPRMRRAVTVRYKFISSSVQDDEMALVCEGTTHNISISGLLLVGPIPRLEWAKDLLVGRMNIGINFLLPGDGDPVKALARVAWLEARDEHALAFRMGLRFVDVPADHRARLSEFLMKESVIP